MMKASSFLETVMLNFFHMLLLSKSIQVASAKQAMLNVLKVVNAKKQMATVSFMVLHISFLDSYYWYK